MRRKEKGGTCFGEGRKGGAALREIERLQLRVEWEKKTGGKDRHATGD